MIKHDNFGHNCNIRLGSSDNSTNIEFDCRKYYTMKKFSPMTIVEYKNVTKFYYK